MDMKSKISERKLREMLKEDKTTEYRMKLDKQKNLNEIAVISEHLSSANRCSVCKGDLRAESKMGTCVCDKRHPRFTSGSSALSADRPSDGVWEGYNWYEVAKYKMDHIES